MRKVTQTTTLGNFVIQPDATVQTPCTTYVLMLVRVRAIYDNEKWAADIIAHYFAFP